METRRILWTGLATLLAAAAIAGAGGASHSARRQGAAARVTIDNFTFTPATITVSPGTTVTWINRDDMPHTVVASDRSFGSGALDTDESFSHTFTGPGTFVYFCSIHPRMVGKVVVEKR